jgi:hypothetical protein
MYYVCIRRAHCHTLTAPYAGTATHCHTLPRILPIALPHTAARTARIARTLPHVLPNTATHRPTHRRAHCRTLLHTAALSHSRTPLLLTLPYAVYAVSRMRSRTYAVCGMRPTSLCTIINQRVLIRQSRPTELIRRLRRTDEKTTRCEMLSSSPSPQPEIFGRDGSLIGLIGKEVYIGYVLY